MANGKITVIGLGQNVQVDMPTVILKDLGTKEGGLTAPKLAEAVMKQVTGQVVQAVGHIAVEKGVINKAADTLQNLLGGKK